MFFFYVFLILIFLILVFIKYGSVQLHIKNINFSTDKPKGRYFNENYKMEIKLYIFEKINFFKLDLTKKKIERKIIKQDWDKIKEKLKKDSLKFDIRALKYLNFKINKMNLNINLGLKDAANCAMCVGTMSSIVAIFLGKFMKENKENCWSIIPIYQNRNFLNIKFDCVFSLRVIHIFYTIYYLIKTNKKYV